MILILQTNAQVLQVYCLLRYVKCVYLLWDVSHNYSMQMPSDFFTADMYSTLFLQILYVSNGSEKG